MTSLATMKHKPRMGQPISREVSVAVRGLLDREELLQRLDRAITKRVTIISAPPGSGKTSLLRAWTDRSRKLRTVSSVSVDGDRGARAGCRFRDHVVRRRDRRCVRAD